VARVFAPSLFAFNPLYLTARGRRLLLFFPDPTAFGNNVRGNNFESLVDFLPMHIPHVDV
jgi:hypothetical protein